MQLFVYKTSRINYQIIIIVDGEAGYLSLEHQTLPLQVKKHLQLVNRLAVLE